MSIVDYYRRVLYSELKIGMYHSIYFTSYSTIYTIESITIATNNTTATTHITITAINLYIGSKY